MARRLPPVLERRRAGLKRRRLGTPVALLWGAVIVAALALSALVILSWATDRGDDEPAPATAYVVEVNRVLRSSFAPIDRVNKAYTSFRANPTEADVASLREAERSLGTVRARVAAVAAPDEARRLRAALLRLLDDQVAFAHEVALLGSYLPRAQAGEEELGKATDTLRKAVGSGGALAPQVAAFDAYAKKLDAIAGRLAAGEVPSTFDSARDAEVRRLQALSESSTDIAGALRARREARINEALDRFTAARSAVPVARERRRAIILYDRRLRLLAERQAAVEAERRRLMQPAG